MPGEQAINHAYARGESEQRRRVTFRLVILAFVASTLLMTMYLTDVNRLQITWGLGASVGIWGWVAIADFRGKVAGQGDFAGLGSNLLAESVARLLLVGFAWAWPSQAPYMLAAAIGLPLFAAWFGSKLWTRSAPPGQPSRQLVRQGTLLSMTLVALALQVMLNGAPLWLAVVPGADQASAGIFVSIASYMRIPMLLGGGLLSVLLSRASADAARSDPKGARDRVRAGLFLVVPISTLAVVVLAVFSPVGLRIIYGPELEPPILVAVLMGTATVAVMVGTTATQGLFANKRQRLAAAIWPIGALLTAAGLLILPSTVLAGSWAVMIGAVTAAAVAVFAVFSGSPPCRDPTRLAATSDGPGG
jgi:O-antigen/teichoic acid export membrane protein